MQEDYPTSAQIRSRYPVVFWRSFISALFLSFVQLHQSSSEMKFQKNFLPLDFLVFQGFLNHLPKDDKHFGADRKKMHFAL